ncbi:helix-turn-helix domain-containing protein [Burkholderia pseudomallei]|uniref:helix-turn-helix domain-containing protein n=1 Tax=Burkholderia pseudomallei TaxID=28450 RepID=UPI0011788C89|nr:helix-turn-helix transcriptional regulator [Burkholderia pseudomallei]
MNISQLIDAAREKAGSSATLAEGLGMHPNRLTDWKAGRRKPEASEIAYLAEQAGLPVLETVAEIEGQLNGRYAHIWKTALANLRAASVGGVLALLVWTGFGGTIPNNAQAAAAHCLHTAGVTGSIPVPPTKEFAACGDASNAGSSSSLRRQRKATRQRKSPALAGLRLLTNPTFL